MEKFIYFLPINLRQIAVGAATTPSPNSDEFLRPLGTVFVIPVGVRHAARTIAVRAATQQYVDFDLDVLGPFGPPRLFAHRYYTFRLLALAAEILGSADVALPGSRIPSMLAATLA